ncbi:transcriptional regulatory protein [Phlyctema vagabunda]|uniref:Transcriptional regulatory protein n=1 Tax=Phlyctema vagabunda TaxID=108571 RepID=A0ABR4PMU7_9HELO
MEESRKRKRDVLSCRDCRRRKVRCDRELPTCGRCRRAGVGDLCSYESQPALAIQDEPDLESAPVTVEESQLSAKQRREVDPSDLVSTVASQAQTIKHLENKLALLQRTRARDAVANQPRGAESVEEEEGRVQEMRLFRGKAFKTQFFGTSHPTCLIQEFSEARAFMAEVFQNSNLQHLRQEARKLDAICKARGLEADFQSVNVSPVEQLLSQLPPRAMADRLILLYFDSIETIYKILHKPTFMACYQLFWTTPQDADGGFVVLLFLAMSITRCMLPDQPLSYNPSGSSARSEAHSWIRACDVWIQKQSNKHRTLQIYQARVLRHVATITNSYKVKEIYSSAQALMSYFKSAGMHREPRALVASGGKCSVFEQEMRRRLWACVVEIELEASLDRGLAPTTVALYCDCDTPLNIDDDDLHEGLSAPPAALPDEQYTTCSYLRHSAQTRELRTSLTTIINNPQLCPSFIDILEHEQQIHRALGRLPDWKGKEQQVAKTALDVQLHQFLLLLHSPSARSRGYSRFVCYETAASIISTQHQLFATHGQVALYLLREDVLRAGLSLCYARYLLGQSQTPSPSNFAQLSDQVLQGLEERLSRTGCGFQLLWYDATRCISDSDGQREGEGGGLPAIREVLSQVSRVPGVSSWHYPQPSCEEEQEQEKQRGRQDSQQNQNQNPAQGWLALDNHHLDMHEMGDFRDEWFWPLFDPNGNINSAF